ncbi:MAG: hypothetical protein AB8B64_20375 [Granulosicoccus sp.]
MNVWLLSSGILTTAIWGIHTFLGGPSIARPLLSATDLGAVPKWTQYYCWHLVTITLAAMAVGLGYAAFVPEAHDVALLISFLALLFALFGLLLPLRAGVTYAEMPQGFLFLPVAGLAFVGVMV